MPDFFSAMPRLLALSLLTAAIAACSSQEQPLEVQVTRTNSFEQAVAGGVQTSTITLNAEVAAIDHATRSVTLRDAQGNRQTLEVGPNVMNFHQVKVGDQVSVQMVEELAILLLDKNAIAPESGGAALVAGAAEGNLPAKLVAATIEVTGTVSAVDEQAHTATLNFADGSSKVVKVRRDVPLRQDLIGREVVFRLTKAVAVQVERQQPAAKP